MMPPVALPPVQLPVSGRTLGRHVSLGPGWESNKEDPGPDYSQPSTSAAAPALVEASRGNACEC